MEKQKADSQKVQANKKRNIILVRAGLVVLLSLFVFMQFSAPGRSAAAYCQTYKEEKARLAQLPGDSWPSGVFNDAISNAGEFATSFSRLERVAPDEIRPDVATLGSLYQKIHDDPSQAIAASLSGVAAETSVKQWTLSHCTK